MSNPEDAFASGWIAHTEKWDDPLRRNFVEPFLERAITAAGEKAVIADVGCGWGLATKFVTTNQTYIGIDPSQQLLAYTARRFPAAQLSLGALPNIPCDDATADLTICSMALHYTDQLETSLESLARITKPHGSIVIIEFADAGIAKAQGSFAPGYTVNGRTWTGTYNLPSGFTIPLELHCFSEAELEAAMSKHFTIAKEPIGPLFTGYSLTKVTNK